MNRFTHAVVIAQVLITTWIGCSSGERSSRPPVMKPPNLGSLPAEMTVKQRSTTDVPGSNGILRLSVDDITGGQVMATLVHKDGGAVLAATSLKQGESATFKLGEDAYKLTVRDLNNALVGEDFATIVISTGSAPERLSEREKIERLLSMIESDEGVVFIRSRVEHSAKDAADHLRSKWQAAGGAITTVDQFIDQIATKSSLSDEPYRVRLPNGKEVLAGEYLRDKLDQIEGGP